MKIKNIRKNLKKLVFLVSISPFPQGARVSPQPPRTACCSAPPSPGAARAASGATASRRGRAGSSWTARPASGRFAAARGPTSPTACVSVRKINCLLRPKKVAKFYMPCYSETFLFFQSDFMHSKSWIHTLGNVNYLPCTGILACTGVGSPQNVLQISWSSRSGSRVWPNSRWREVSSQSKLFGSPIYLEQGLPLPLHATQKTRAL